MEQWKTIDWLNNSADNKYEVSTTGKVRNIKTGRILKAGKNNYGYYMVRLGNKMYLVHRLVAQAFIEQTNYIQNEVDHIDRNKQNNNVENLRWVTKSENLVNRDYGLAYYQRMFIKNLFNEYITSLTDEDLSNIIKDYSTNKSVTIQINPN